MRPLTQSPRSGSLGPPLQFCRTCLLRTSPSPAAHRPVWHSGLDSHGGVGGRRRTYATDVPSPLTPELSPEPPSPFMPPPPAKRPRPSPRTADGSATTTGKRGGGRKTPSKNSSAQAAAAAGQTQLRLWRETLDVLRKLETAQGRLAEHAQAGSGGGSSSNKKTGGVPSSSTAATAGTNGHPRTGTGAGKSDTSRTAAAGPSAKKGGQNAQAAAAELVAAAAASGGPGKSSPDQVKMLTSALHLLKTVLSTQAAPPPLPQQQQQQQKKQKQGGGTAKVADGGSPRPGKAAKKRPAKKKSEAAADPTVATAMAAAAATTAAAATKPKAKAAAAGPKKKTGGEGAGPAAGEGPRAKPFAYVTQPLKSPFRVSKVNARHLALTPVEEAERRPVPRLHYGLDRALFNPGVYHLQDPRSRVYNFDPYLATIMPLREFDFNALKQYVTSSKDATLGAMAARHQKRYAGSTSSMTSMLSHFHFLLSGWRPINPAHTSRAFTPESLNFTRITKAPAATFLHWRPADGTYAIDADKEFDTANILSMLGKSMEKLLTLSRADFEKYRVTKSHQLTDAERNDPEAFHYTTFGDFLMRSQLDAHDARLPGSGMFDLKTRAVVSIRMDAQAFQRGLGYEIRHRIGQWESFEREYFDMIRSAFLKYSLQVRMGRMDGIYVAFHNTRRIFGFQYISINEMDLALHGPSAVGDDDAPGTNSGGALGDREFLLSLHLLNAVLDRATERFPGRSLRLHIETRPSEAAPFMYIFAKPVNAAEIEEVQNASKASVEAFENEILGIVPAAAAAATTTAEEAAAAGTTAEAAQRAEEEEEEEDDDDDDREAAARAAHETDLDVDFESDADDSESLDVWESMRQKVEETMENEAQGLESVRDTIEDALEQSGLLHGRSPEETRAYVRALLEAVTDATDTATVAERILNDEGADAAEATEVIEEEGDDGDEVEDVEAEEAEDAEAAAAEAAEAEAGVEDGEAAAGEAGLEPEDARADRDTEPASASADETDDADETEGAHEPAPDAAPAPVSSSSSSSSSSPSSSDTISLKDLIIKLAAQVEASQARETTAAAPAAPTGPAVAGSEEEPEDKDRETAPAGGLVSSSSSELVDAPKNKRFERILSEMMASAVREKRKGGEAEAEAEGTGEAAAGEATEAKASSSDTAGAAAAAGGDATGTGADEEELLGMILTIRNKVNGRYVVRPERLARSDSWTVEYAIEEIRPARRAQSLYELLKKRRKTLLSPRATTEATASTAATTNGSGKGGGGGSSGKASFDREYMARLHAMSARGRRFRKLEDERARGRPVQVYGEDQPQTWEAVFGEGEK